MINKNKLVTIAIALFTLYLLRECWEIKSSFSLMLLRLGT